MRLLVSTALAISLLAVPALAETSVGVTAAVNPMASGTSGGNVRTLSLGDNVIYNERIQTSAEGLVQILLADGTTFMVGPNSDLVIDSFVYDPNAGTAQVTASFTKGVLRFIGGQTSKTDGGVTLNTPVGTMGIRGAMVDVVLDPPPGTPQHIDMLFGNEVTLSQGQDLLGRLYASGYSLVMGDSGLFEVMKTPPGFGSQIQLALAGKPGTSGGAVKGPTNEQVNRSEVAGNNRAGSNPGLSQRELQALLQAAAEYDQLRDFILNNQNIQGFAGGVFTGDEGQHMPATNDYEAEYDDSGLFSYTPDFADFAFNANGEPVSIKAGFLTSNYYCDSDCDTVLIYEAGPSGGKISWGLVGEPLTSIATTDDYLFNHDAVRQDNPLNRVSSETELPISAELNCSDCAAFVKWGFWGFTAEDVQIGDSTQNIEHMGTWITGDMTTAAQLQGLAQQSESNIMATYSGDAVGVVANYEVQGTYVATGDLDMEWNFGAREGVVNISGFDVEHLGGEGLEAEYFVSSPADGGTGFLGHPGDVGYWGTAQGAFVNNGSDVAGGVMGTWTYENSGYLVDGIFMGVRGPDVTLPP